MTSGDLLRALALVAALLTAVRATDSVAGDGRKVETVAGAGGVPLSVTEAGPEAAPAIIFIHGFGQSSLAFAKQFESTLAQSYHLIAYDLRGHGASGKPWKAEDMIPGRIWAEDLNAVMEAKHVSRAILAGWSYGGFIVSDYVREFGLKRLSGIVLMGSLGGLVAGMKPQDAVYPNAQQVRENARRSRLIDFAANLSAARSTADMYATPEMQPADREMLFAAEIAMPAYVRQLIGQRTYDNAALTAQINLPVLLVRGSNDSVMPQAGSERLQAELTHAKLSVYPETGHLAFWQRAARFNDELAAFAAAAFRRP